MGEIRNTQTTMKVDQEKWDRIFHKEKPKGWLLNMRDGSQKIVEDINTVPLEDYLSAERINRNELSGNP